MISQELVRKFKNLYLTKNNIALSNEEAARMTTDFVKLMGKLMKKQSKKRLNSLKNNSTD